jgi:hypothetical protein
MHKMLRITVLKSFQFSNSIRKYNSKRFSSGEDFVQLHFLFLFCLVIMTEYLVNLDTFSQKQLKLLNV